MFELVAQVPTTTQQTVLATSDFMPPGIQRVLDLRGLRAGCQDRPKHIPPQRILFDLSPGQNAAVDRVDATGAIARPFRYQVEKQV